MRERCRVKPGMTFNLDKSSPWQANPAWHSTWKNRFPGKQARHDIQPG